jgi:DNA polymerase
MELWSRAWKQQRLSELADDWLNCTRCGLCETRKNVVFGEGDPDADLVFIGEGPGNSEDETGRPFVGSSGELFDIVLGAADIDRCDVFITNLVGCRPPGNRDPAREEKQACIGRVHETVYLIDPLVIVTLGKVPLQALAKGRAWSIEKEHGQLFSSPAPSARSQGDKCGVEIPGRVFPRTGDDKKKYHLEYDLVPLFHPAYLARTDSYNRRTKEFVQGGPTQNTVKDLRQVIERVQQLKEQYDIVAKDISRR